MRHTTLLFSAALAGDRDGILLALEQGADINAKDPGLFPHSLGHSVLQHVVEKGDLETACFLMESGADPYQKNNNPILKMSARDSARVLTEQGHAHIKPLHDFFEMQDIDLLNQAFHGNVSGIEHALQYGAQVNARNSHPSVKGYTPLMHAAGNGRVDAVNYLIEQGADIFAVDEYGKSVLRHTVEGGHLEIAIRLMNLGADPLQKNRDDLCARDCARIVYQYGHMNVKPVHDFFLSQDQKLFIAAKTGDLELAKKAVRYGANIFAIDCDYGNFESIQISAQCGNLPVLEYLLSQGADARARNQYGMTARDIANALKNLSEHPNVKYIAQFFDAKDQALFTAIKFGNVDGVIKAVREGANLEAIDVNYSPHQYRPVHWAAHIARSDIFNLLVSLGANPISVNNNNHSPHAIASILHPKLAPSFPKDQLENHMPRKVISMLEWAKELCHISDHGVSAGVLHKRMFKTNHGVNLSPQDPRTGASGLCAQAVQNYLTKNAKYAYTAQDNPNGQPFAPLDGTYTWTNPGASPSNPCSAVRYTEGPQTKAWLDQRDSNYRARIAREQAAKVAAEQARVAAEVERQRQAAATAERQRQAAIAAAEAERNRQAAIAAAAAERQRQAEIQRQAQLAAQQREAARIAAEAQAREQARIAAEAQAREQARIAAEAQAREQARIAAEDQAREQARIAAEDQAREQARIAAEATLRVEAERQRQAEITAREQADRAILNAVRSRPTTQGLFSRTNSNNTFARTQSQPITNTLPF